MIIESAQNKIFKEAVSLKEKKFRDESGFFLVEGEKQVSEITKEWNIKYLLVSSAYKRKTVENTTSFIISEKIFGRIVSAVTPQGIAAVVEKKKFDADEILRRNGFFVILEKISDPGNLGAIIRSADAFGAKAVFVSSQSADIYSDKTMRSTMGSFFHLPVIAEVSMQEIIALMKKNKIPVLAASLNAKKMLSECNFSAKSAFIIGNESAGISAETEKSVDTLFKIEMPGKAESLNAAIAASIVMYEIADKKCNIQAAKQSNNR